MSHRLSSSLWIALVALLCMALASGNAFAYNVAVMFPGTLGGNPLASAIEAGVDAANKLPNVTARLIESPVTARWESDLTTLAATGMYDLIVTFTSGMAPLVPNVASQFPNQKFALLDAEAPAILSNVVSLVYSDRELGFLAGVLAGLVAQEPSLGGSAGTSIGLISGDSYPNMDFHIKPGYIAGARYVNPGVQVRYAVVGNWADPITANELAQNMYSAGANVIFAVAGGGGSGIFNAARAAGKYAIGVNTNQNAEAPGIILGSILKRIDNSVVAVIERAANGQLTYGSVEFLGMREGAIDVARDELYEQHVPAAIRQRVEQVIAEVAAGSIDVEALAFEALEL